MRPRMCAHIALLPSSADETSRNAPSNINRYRSQESPLSVGDPPAYSLVRRRKKQTIGPRYIASTPERGRLSSRQAECRWVARCLWSSLGLVGSRSRPKHGQSNEISIEAL